MLDAESVAVIGVGNVAIDVARILVRDPAELADTDIPEPVLDVLRASRVREVHVIGRRGPAQAKFTTKELRELGDLPGVITWVEPSELDLDAQDPSGASAELATSDRRVRGNMVAMRGWASGPAAAGGRQLRVRFWRKPLEITGAQRVGAIVLERTRITADGTFAGTGEVESLPVQMVLRSVGYQSVPLEGVPFDERTRTVPSAAGRVLGDDGQPLPGEYVAGWLKRGPTGVIGTNKADGAQTAQAILADLAGGPDVGEGELPRPGLLRLPAISLAAAEPDPAASSAVVAAVAVEAAALQAVLDSRGVRPVSYADWLLIEAAEAELARSLGRGERVKLPGAAAVWGACRPQ
jgi:ferredoxin--NADP+ reductase